jgi:PAS domain S-box-containing protein
LSKGAPRAGVGQLWSPRIEQIAHHDAAKAALVAATALLYYAAAEFGLALNLPATMTPAMWPPAGVLVALLLLTPREVWWLVIIAAAPAHVAAHWRAGVEWTADVPWRLLYDLVLAGGVGVLLRRVLAERNPFGSWRELLVYVSTAVIVAPSLMAFAAPEVVDALRGGTRAGYAETWLTASLSYALPLLTLTPALYLWLQHGLDWLRRGRPLQYLEAALIAVAAAAIYATVAGVKDTDQAFLYLFLLPLLWAAARFGVGGAATIASAGALLWTLVGVVPGELLIVDVERSGVLDLQIYLFAASTTALVLGALSEEGARSARALSDSELRYRTIVESQTDLVCRNLPDTTLTFVNEAYCRYFRSSREELIGRKWIDLLPAGSHPTVRAALAGLSRSAPILVHEHEVLLPDGGVGWMQWVDRAIFDDSGRIVEVQGVGRDLTALKRVEQSLRESEQRFRLVLRATKDVIYDWDVVHDVLWSSAQGGWTSPDAPSNLEEWSRGLHEDDHERYLSDLATVLKSKDVDWEIEYRYSRDGKPMQYVHERACIMRDARGAAVRMIGSIADITDHRRLAEARQALAQVARLATVGEITASITHEINQPLAAIVNNAEAGLLRARGNAPPEVLEIIDDIRKDGLRASDIVERLAVLLRGQEPLQERLAIDELVRDAASLLRTEFRRRRTQLDVRCDGRAIVSGDAARLQQVMLNLLLNALDATCGRAESNRSIEVRTRSLDAARCVQVDVVDSGVGVPAERLGTIFDSFVTTKPHGMGLGLAVTRSIVKAHGGRIWAANNADGAGATFSFELPLAAADDRVDGAESDEVGQRLQH